VEGDVVEVYDPWYESSEQYRFSRSVLDSLTSDGSPAKMVTSYISEDKTIEQSGANCFDPQKVAALSDETLMKLSEPLKYDITFETETYRSGKKHIKKTRYKENPFGKIIGRHEGAQFCTIGQRKGLNIGGHADAVFVIATDTDKNIIYVGEGHRHKGLSRSCTRISKEEIHWIRPDLKMESGTTMRVRVRIRYRQPLQDATLIMRDCGLFILFDAPQRGITAGQFAAWYALPDGTEPDAPEMLGSGVI